jgi:hypothetical protein
MPKISVVIEEEKKVDTKEICVFNHLRQREVEISHTEGIAVMKT